MIFSIIIENHDHTTGKTNVGKLTLVDLAEARVAATGATKERLKEAQSINEVYLHWVMLFQHYRLGPSLFHIVQQINYVAC